MHHYHQHNIVHDSRQHMLNRHLQAGLDSLGAVDLRNSLSSAFSTDALPATLAFDYPTVAALAQLLLSLQSQATQAQVCCLTLGCRSSVWPCTSECCTA
jgi:acyl carrier protein